MMSGNFVFIAVLQGVARPKLVTELKARSFCPIDSKSKSPTGEVDELDGWASNQVALLPSCVSNHHFFRFVFWCSLLEAALVEKLKSYWVL